MIKYISTSVERQKKGSLLSAVLWTDALIKNAVAFLKLSSFTNAAIVKHWYVVLHGKKQGEVINDIENGDPPFIHTNDN